MKAMHHGSHGQIRSVTLDTMVKACALATNNQTANIIDPRDSPEVPVGRSNSGVTGTGYVAHKGGGVDMAGW